MHYNKKKFFLLAKTRFLFTLYFTIFIFSCTIYAKTLESEKDLEIKNYINSCRQDIAFFQNSVKKNSAIYSNKSDIKFHQWYKQGYNNALKLINLIRDEDDCYYALKYYINGFYESHIGINSFITLPQEQYPGLLSVKQGDDHVIIYKDNLTYLKDISIGDKLTHINDISIETFYKDYLLPFYSEDFSEVSLQSASIYGLILDGNRFKPTAKQISVKKHSGKIVKLDLKYTELKDSALVAANQIKQPTNSDMFKVEMVSDGIWIRIPSFFPDKSRILYYQGMLATLKSLAKHKYILFDLRGNIGGASKWSRPIIRNLWGDEFIKSLGTEHNYNIVWEKSLKVSKENFLSFKDLYGDGITNTYRRHLRKGQAFFTKRWIIYRDKDNLFTNEDNSPFNAKIYVLTDHFCQSTCWNFVNNIKQMPNVVHIGKTTTIQSNYSYPKRVTSPSGNFTFFYPTEIIIQPEFKLGNSLIPQEIYEGDFRDIVNLTNWILHITEKE